MKKANNKKNAAVLDSGKFKCTGCGKAYIAQRGNFPASNSKLYAANNGYITICRDCVEQYYQELLKVCSGDEKRALEHSCNTFDWYYSPDAFDMTDKTPAGCSRVSVYPAKMNMRQIKDKGVRYLDTVKDNALRISNESEISSGGKIPAKFIKFFGFGYSDEEYKFLKEQYEDWTERHECQTKVQEEIFKALCVSQLNIQRAQRSGNTKEVSDAMKTFQDLLGTANLKPNQKADNSLTEQHTFGTLIKEWEKEEPIGEPDPEWKDVDGIKKLVDTYFLGHLCNLLHVHNDKEAAYLEEMAKHTVKPPVYEEDADYGDTSILDKYSKRAAVDEG